MASNFTKGSHVSVSVSGVRILAGTVTGLNETMAIIRVAEKEVAILRRDAGLGPTWHYQRIPVTVRLLASDPELVAFRKRLKALEEATRISRTTGEVR